VAEFNQTRPFSRQAALNRAGVGVRRKAQASTPKPSFVPISTFQLPAGAFMQETGRVGGMTAEDAGRLGGYMDEMGRVFVPPAQPGILNFPPGYKEAELAAGLDAERSRPGAGFPEQQGLVFGLDKNRNVDRRKSDVYKQYAQTPEGQFERYFKTQEMAPYFGTSFQGTGAPTSAQAMIDLASQVAAPTTAPLASFYAAQSATGRGSMDEIISAMGYKGTPMEQWAKSNPMLAFREYNKKFPAGAPTQGPTPALPGPPMGEGDTVGQRALEAAQYQLSGDEPASVRQRTDNFLAGVGNPVTPTEALNQGEAVDANRGAQYLREAQKMKTQGYQQFLPTSQPLF
jgi:hypothetical protein